MKDNNQCGCCSCDPEDALFDILKKNLPPRRYKHVLEVVKISEMLAKKHGAETKRARLAAALHDIARSWKDKDLILYARNKRLRVPDNDFVLKYQPVILHSFVGEDVAKDYFQIKDREILSAIRNHSLGAEKMGVLEKIVYVADLLSSEKDHHGRKELEKLALKDLDASFLEAMRRKIIYTLGAGKPLYPGTLRTWNYYVSDHGGKK